MFLNITNLLNITQHHQIFAAKMLDEMNFTQEQLDRLFPRLDDLVELHANFLRELLNLQAKNSDKFVEEIGAILVNQVTKFIFFVFCLSLA